MMSGIIAAILKALLGFFQESRENDKNRQQTERLSKDAERSRVELEKARESLDVAQNRSQIDEAVRDLSTADALERLRASVRPGTES